MRSSVLAENIKFLRKGEGLKQQDIAKIAGTTVARISQIEKGVVHPSVAILGAYAQALNCTIDFLYAIDTTLQQFLKAIQYKTIDGNYDEAVEQSCFEMMNMYDEYSMEQSVLNNTIAKLYLNQGSCKKAYYFFNLIKGRHDEDLAWNYINRFNLALTCYHLRRYDQAQIYLDEIERFYSFHGNLEDKFRVVHLRGSICIQQRNYEAAEGLFQDLLKYAQENGKLYEEYSAIHNLGYNFLLQKKYQRAVFQLSQASTKAYAANDAFKICEIAADLSQCYIDIGEYPEAEQIIQTALERAKDNYVETKLRFNLARCKQDLDQKLILLEQVCFKAEKMNYPVLLKDIYKQLGKIYRLLGRYEESSSYFEKALRVCESL